MSQLSVKFEQSSLKFSNDKCCEDGISLLLNIEGIIPGHNYRCELSSISRGSVVFSQNNFDIISSVNNVSIPIGLSLKNSRSYIIKCRITDLDMRQSYRYWIPNKDEWYKAAYYSGSDGLYYSYATQNNQVPLPAESDPDGNGLSGNNGNFANFENQSDWAGMDGNLTSVGTNGGPSYYGTYDQNGNINEWIDDTNTDYKHYAGGSWSSDAAKLKNISDIRVNTEANDIGFRICAAKNKDLDINLDEYVLVSGSDPANNSDNNDLGSVRYDFYIKKYPVTNSEYSLFLNSTANKTDRYGLYNNHMNIDTRGGIVRNTNIDQTYTYVCKNNMENKPVNFVSWLDCARYCNWIYNKAMNTNDTERGAYDLTQSSNFKAPYSGLNYSEDILTIECGDVSDHTVVFNEETKNLTSDISCDKPKHIIAVIENAKIGRSYAYYFSGADENFANITPISGIVIAGSKEQNINTIYNYTGSLKKVDLNLEVIDLVDNIRSATSISFPCTDGCKEENSNNGTL